jgi:hypothetical protein
MCLLYPRLERDTCPSTCRLGLPPLIPQNKNTKEKKKVEVETAVGIWLLVAPVQAYFKLLPVAKAAGALCPPI